MTESGAEDLIASGKLPSHLADAINAVRNIGNFAAHPVKSTNTGEIVDVEPGAAEWLLNTIEAMVRFLFRTACRVAEEERRIEQEATGRWQTADEVSEHR